MTTGCDPYDWWQGRRREAERSACSASLLIGRLGMLEGKVANLLRLTASVRVKSSFSGSVDGIPLRSVTTKSSCNSARIYRTLWRGGRFACAGMGESARSGAFDLGLRRRADVCEPAAGCVDGACGTPFVYTKDAVDRLCEWRRTPRVKQSSCVPDNAHLSSRKRSTGLKNNTTARLVILAPRLTPSLARCIVSFGYVEEARNHHGTQRRPRGSHAETFVKVSGSKPR